MALLDSVSASQTSSHASVARVPSSQSSPTHHSLLYTSAKVTGVILFILLCALIIVNAQASGKEANDEFNAANEDSAAALNLESKTQKAAHKGDTAPDDTSGNSVSASISNGNVEVSIDGKPVEVPAGSNYSKTTTDANGTTTVNISSNSTNSGSANNGFTSSSTFVTNNSSSFSSNAGNSYSSNFYSSP